MISKGFINSVGVVFPGPKTEPRNLTPVANTAIPMPKAANIHSQGFFERSFNRVLLNKIVVKTSIKGATPKLKQDGESQLSIVNEPNR